jgi:hypothetical protein
MIHSLVVMMGGVGSVEAGAMAAMLFGFALWKLLVLTARTGGAGARYAGEPAEEGVDTAGEAIIAEKSREQQQQTRNSQQDDNLLSREIGQEKMLEFNQQLSHLQVAIR